MDSISNVAPVLNLLGGSAASQPLVLGWTWTGEVPAYWKIYHSNDEISWESGGVQPGASNAENIFGDEATYQFYYIVGVDIGGNEVTTRSATLNLS